MRDETEDMRKHKGISPEIQRALIIEYAKAIYRLKDGDPRLAKIEAEVDAYLGEEGP